MWAHPHQKIRPRSDQHHFSTQPGDLQGGVGGGRAVLLRGRLPKTGKLPEPRAFLLLVLKEFPALSQKFWPYLTLCAKFTGVNKHLNQIPYPRVEQVPRTWEVLNKLGCCYYSLRWRSRFIYKNRIKTLLDHLVLREVCLLWCIVIKSHGIQMFST